MTFTEEQQAHIKLACKNGDDYRAGKQAIKEKNLPISGVISSLVELYGRVWKNSAADINCGGCEMFALDIIEIVNNGEETENCYLAWHDDMNDCTEEEADKYSHCFVIYNDRFYDSQSENGEDDWRKLRSFS